MKMFDILTTVITMPSCSPTLHSMITNYLARERNAHHGNKFRMADISELAKERAYLEKVCWRSFPNAISNW